MDEKAQTAIEYVLLVASVIFLVIIVFFVVKDRVFGGSGSSITNSSDTIISTIRNATG